LIRFIAALDMKNGIANEHGIPWQGKLPSDVAYFRAKTIHSSVMMGYGWYVEQNKPLADRQNLVTTTKPEALREGFEKVSDARDYLQKTTKDVWVGGGSGLFTSILDLADELYLTRIEADFYCTKFFPTFTDSFTLRDQSAAQTENGIIFRFEIWQRI
jgi:dihydrofolate reductase